MICFIYIMKYISFLELYVRLFKVLIELIEYASIMHFTPIFPVSHYPAPQVQNRSMVQKGLQAADQDDTLLNRRI